MKLGLNIVFVFLFSTVILSCITFICAIAGDIPERTQSIAGDAINNYQKEKKS